MLETNNLFHLCLFNCIKIHPGLWTLSEPIIALKRAIKQIFEVFFILNVSLLQALLWFLRMAIDSILSFNIFLNLSLDKAQNSKTFIKKD
jgi:hypothetical protein